MKICILSILIVVSLTCWSQTNSYLKKGELKIGEQTELTYEFSYHDNPDSIIFHPFSKIIPCYKRTKVSSLNNSETSEIEIIGQFKDSLIKKNNINIWRGTYRITIWDTGYLIIPPTSLIFKDSIYDFEPVLMHITIPQKVEGKELYDIKETYVDIETDPIFWLKSYGWILVLILIIIGLVFYFKRKKQAKTKPERELSLKERSLVAVDALEKSKLWQRGELKKHYIELSFIFRSYLSARYNMNFLEKTSLETSLLLSKIELSEDTVRVIRSVLDYSDLVKFAKSTPEEDQILRNLTQVRQIIIETSPLEIEYAD